MSEVEHFSYVYSGVLGEGGLPLFAHILLCGFYAYILHVGMCMCVNIFFPSWAESQPFAYISIVLPFFLSTY